MKKYILCGVMMMALSVQAADIETQKASIRSVDKITGRTKTMTLEIGKETALGNLKISLDRCLKKPPEEMPEDKAFLRIVEDDEKVVFQGWMFSSNPALSAMEHPIYDIWLLECVPELTEKAADVSGAQPVAVAGEAVGVESLPEIDEEVPETLETEQNKTPSDSASEEVDNHQ